MAGNVVLKNATETAWTVYRARHPMLTRMMADAVSWSATCIGDGKSDRAMPKNSRPSV